MNAAEKQTNREKQTVFIQQTREFGSDQWQWINAHPLRQRVVSHCRTSRRQDYAAKVLPSFSTPPRKTFDE